MFIYIYIYILHYVYISYNMYIYRELGLRLKQDRRSTPDCKSWLPTAISYHFELRDVKT